MSKNNLDVRQELAALYRILDIYGMTDLANQCAAARSSENKNTFLENKPGQKHTLRTLFLLLLLTDLVCFPFQGTFICCTI